MKRAELAEIKNLGVKVILAKATDIKGNLIKLQLAKDVKNPKEKAQKRRDLAQLLTILRQKELVEQLKQEATK